ncbi:NBAS subunit of NRZ tethering complex-like [Macrobrachium nipponense]|uniref:NBAS subunit of NRZ tethering complex-like n=1 Tax=Macrobrachium nipponense TaxID=159736 RepID=UPI0030C87CF9
MEPLAGDQGEAVEQDTEDPAEFLYIENPELRKFQGLNVTAETISLWYQERAREIEKCSHFVDAALDLLKLGRERNVENLEELHDTLDTLEVLVYEAGLYSMTLDTFTNLDDSEKIVQLMSTSTPETYIQNIRRWLIPFLTRCEKWKPGSAKKLLHDYIVTTAKEDLGLPLKILQHSRPDQQAPIISSPEEMMTIALECVYTCEKENQLMRAFAIFECLPVRESGKGTSENLTKLHDLADAMEAHLTAAELLSNYGVCVTPCQLRQLQSDRDKVREILTKLTRAAARREPRLTDSDWRKLLYDMLELQQKVFTCVEPLVCFELMVAKLQPLQLSRPPELRGNVVGGCVTLRDVTANMIVVACRSILFRGVIFRRVVMLVAGLLILETIDIILERVYRSQSTAPLNIPEALLRMLLEICTKKAPFSTHRGQMYPQKDGVAMGSPLGVLFANFYMDTVEERVFARMQQPLRYRCDIDDIFVQVDAEDEVEALRTRPPEADVCGIPIHMPTPRLQRCLHWIFLLLLAAARELFLNDIMLHGLQVLQVIRRKLLLVLLKKVIDVVLVNDQPHGLAEYNDLVEIWLQNSFRIVHCF